MHTLERVKRAPARRSTPQGALERAASNNEVCAATVATRSLRTRGGCGETEALSRPRDKPCTSPLTVIAKGCVCVRACCDPAAGKITWSPTGQTGFPSRVADGLRSHKSHRQTNNPPTEKASYRNLSLREMLANEAKWEKVQPATIVPQNNHATLFARSPPPERRHKPGLRLCMCMVQDHRLGRKSARFWSLCRRAHIMVETRSTETTSWPMYLECQHALAIMMQHLEWHQEISVLRAAPSSTTCMRRRFRRSDATRTCCLHV